MVKEFSYRGVSAEKLRALSLEEFASLLPSRARRSLLRQANAVKKFLARTAKAAGKPIRTHERQLVIVPQMIGLTVYVYSGREFRPVKIEEEMLGHRLGEFVLTRQKVEHGAPGIGATRSSAFLSVK